MLHSLPSLPCIIMHYYDIIVTVLLIRLAFIRLVIQSALSVSRQWKLQRVEWVQLHCLCDNWALRPVLVFMRLSTSPALVHATQENVVNRARLIFFRQKAAFINRSWVEVFDLVNVSIWCLLYATSHIISKLSSQRHEKCCLDNADQWLRNTNSDS